MLRKCCHKQIFTTLHEKSSFHFSYDSETGVFTVPPGGDGFYFFSVYALSEFGELFTFDIRMNNQAVCAAYGDMTSAGGGYDQRHVL